MKKLITATLALALLGGTAAVAQAQPYRAPAYTHDYRGHDRFDNSWRRGMVFRDFHRFTVNDWRRHGLHRPARNQVWVQRGNVFMLVNRRGVVLDVVFAPRGFHRY